MDHEQEQPGIEVTITIADTIVVDKPNAYCFIAGLSVPEEDDHAHTDPLK